MTFATGRTRCQSIHRRLGGYALASLSLLTLGACDEFIDPDNAPPIIEAVRYCTQADANGTERVYIAITVSDAERDAVDLAITSDGTHLLIGATGSGASGVVTERPSKALEHLVEWSIEGPSGHCPTAQCLARPGTAPASVSVSITATDSAESVTQSSHDLTGPERCDDV